jgi:hypothetical protein
VNRADRYANLALFLVAAAAWAGLAYVMVTSYPTDSAGALLSGALLLGGAIAFTVAPLFWLGSYVLARRIAYRGAWWRAGRRAALSGLVATMFVLLRGQGAFSVPLALFVVVMAVLVELTLSLRR